MTHQQSRFSVVFSPKLKLVNLQSNPHIIDGLAIEQVVVDEVQRRDHLVLLLLVLAGLL